METDTTSQFYEAPLSDDVNRYIARDFPDGYTLTSDEFSEAARVVDENGAKSRIGLEALVHAEKVVGEFTILLGSLGLIEAVKEHQEANASRSRASIMMRHIHPALGYVADMPKVINTLRGKGFKEFFTGQNGESGRSWRTFLEAKKLGEIAEAAGLTIEAARYAMAMIVVLHQLGETGMIAENNALLSAFEHDNMQRERAWYQLRLLDEALIQTTHFQRLEALLSAIEKTSKGNFATYHGEIWNLHAKDQIHRTDTEAIAGLVRRSVHLNRLFGQSV